MWEASLQEAEKLFESARVPSSEELITLIKRVNPTSLQHLSEAERERGYQVKARLQSLLLENYGEAFYLAPHPYAEEIILIKHLSLPSIDACHADLKSLTPEALDAVGQTAPAPAAAKIRKEKNKGVAQPGDLAKEMLRAAQQLLDRYDYPMAEAVLAGLRVAAPGDLETLEKAARLLLEELGAYQSAVDLLLAHPPKLLKERSTREILALAYYRNGSYPEARTVFEALPPSDLAKGSLFAWAQLALKDGNALNAFHLLQLAEEKEGFLGGLAELRQDIEAALLRQADPVVNQALAARQQGDPDLAASLARQALACHPGHPKAREILSALACEREQAEIDRLREELAHTEGPIPRLELLARLLEKDTAHRDQLRELMAREKALRKKEQVAEQLQVLAQSAQEKNWAECFDTFAWLNRQELAAEQLREASLISPYFAVLFQNQRLAKLSDKVARGIWLDYIKAKTALEAGQREAAFHLLDPIKHYFLPYPEFSTDYQSLLEAERQKARQSTRELLEQLDATESAAAAWHLVGALRRKAALLSEVERDELLTNIEAREASLPPEQTDAERAKAYQAALLCGNTPKAALLRAEITDLALVERAEARVRRAFRIETQPIEVRFSDDVSIDRVGDLSWEQPIRCMCLTDRHIMFRDQEGLIVVQPEQKTAMRYKAPQFKNLLACDHFLHSETFLFKTRENSKLIWRADLDGEHAEFTAVLNAAKDLGVDVGMDIKNAFLSSDKEYEYYVNLTDKNKKRPGRVVKRRVGTKNPVSDAIQISGCPALYMGRLSSAPDSFIIGGKEETHIYNKSLSSEVGVKMKPVPWEVDRENGHIYYQWGVLHRSDLRFKDVIRFPKSETSLAFEQEHGILCLSPATQLAMVAYGNRAALYDYANERISQPFTLAHIVSTKPAKKWYCYDYCPETLTITLRDVSEVVMQKLRWDKLPSVRKNRSSQNMMRLCKMIFFGYAEEARAEQKAKRNALRQRAKAGKGEAESPEDSGALPENSTHAP